MLTLSGNFNEQHGLKASPHTLLLSYKGKHHDYIVQNTKQHLHQVIKVNTSKQGLDGHQVPPDVTP